MVDKWKKIASDKIADFHIFKIRQDTSISPRTEQPHSFVVLETGDWINVIPITPDGKIIFIHQYRHGTEEITLEIPGGMVDPDDPNPEVAARRELREETGFDGERFIHIGSVAPNPAFINNRCHTFLALNVYQAGHPQFDGAEDIIVEKFSWLQIPRLITSRRITHALVVAAFYHFDRYREKHPDWHQNMLE